jgi:hypothetical protein
MFDIDQPAMVLNDVRDNYNTQIKNQRCIAQHRQTLKQSV